MKSYKDFPLRLRKPAQNKINLATTFSKLLKERPFSDISVKELCDLTTISEASFFNYFKKKSDLLSYIYILYMIELAWFAKVRSKEQSGILAIKAIFEFAAKRIEENMPLVNELFYFKVKVSKYSTPPSITEVEKILAFPDLDGVDKVELEWLDTILLKYVNLAVTNKELPQSADITSVAISLITIYYGVPMFSGMISKKNIKKIYDHQLSLVLWAAKNKNPILMGPYYK